MTVRIECPEGHAIDIDLSRRKSSVACPRCFRVFVPDIDLDTLRHAKPEKGKARRARDDDEDDDDDDEEDDDDEDDDDEEEEDEEEEEPINWTPKKRQLVKLQTALKSVVVGCYAHMVFLGLDSLVLLIAVLIGFERFLADASPEYARPIQMLYGIGGAAIGGPCLLVIYGSHIFAWFMELMGPSKSGSRGSAIVAILLILTPLLLFIFYFILTLILKDNLRPQVASNLFNLVLGFAVFCALIALYWSISAIGGIAAYLNLTTEKNKPSALGWFVVGSFIIRGIASGGAIAAMTISPGMIGCIVLFGTIGLTCQTYWMSLGSLRELMGVIKAVQDAINKSLRED